MNADCLQRDRPIRLQWDAGKEGREGVQQATTPPPPPPPQSFPRPAGGEGEEEVAGSETDEAACRDNVGQTEVKEGQRSERRRIFITNPHAAAAATSPHHHVSNLASVIAPAAGFILRSDVQEHKKPSCRVPALSMATGLTMELNPAS